MIAFQDKLCNPLKLEGKCIEIFDCIKKEAKGEDLMTKCLFPVLKLEVDQARCLHSVNFCGFNPFVLAYYNWKRQRIKS